MLRLIVLSIAVLASAVCAACPPVQGFVAAPACSAVVAPAAVYAAPLVQQYVYQPQAVVQQYAAPVVQAQVYAAPLVQQVHVAQVVAHPVVVQAVTTGALGVTRPVVASVRTGAPGVIGPFGGFHPLRSNGKPTVFPRPFR